MKNTIYRNSDGVKIDVGEVIDKYRHQYKLSDIALNIGCSRAQIDKILSKETYRTRPHSYKHKIDHKYFDKINTEKKAYIFGFLCADGSVSKKSVSQLKITLQEADKDILEIIRANLKSSSPIDEYTYKGKRYCRISFYSKQICGRLKKYGCGVNKTDHLTWDDIKLPRKLMRHFVRGYFDGDGCISFWLQKEKYLKGHWNITSTKAFATGLRKFIYDTFGYLCYVSQRHKNNPNNKTIELSGNRQIISIMNWMYNDASIYLQRKKHKYEEYLQIYEK
jgi:hypothetical protein